MKIVSLASGSRGNCTYICSNNTHILVDVGVSFAYLSSNLQKIGINENSLDAVLITHEHGDHTKGLSVLIKKNPSLKIFAHPKTMLRLVEKINIPLANQFAITQSDFFIKDLTVSAFSILHDSAHCLGFSFYENGKKFSIATDIGEITQSLIENLLGSELVFIESNFDPDLLYYCDKYPGMIKSRIASNKGHLSNIECAKLVSKLIKNGTKRFALAHISQNSNTVDIALKTVVEYLTFNGLFDNVYIEVLQQSLSKIFEI